MRNSTIPGPAGKKLKIGIQTSAVEIVLLCEKQTIVSEMSGESRAVFLLGFARISLRAGLSLAVVETGIEHEIPLDTEEEKEIYAMHRQQRNKTFNRLENEIMAICAAQYIP